MSSEPSITLRVSIRCPGLVDPGCRAANLCFNEVVRMVSRSALIRSLQDKGYEWSIDDWRTGDDSEGGAA